MSIPTDFSFTRYLAAKRSVDDRALNRLVWQRLLDELRPAEPAAPLRILEVGAGTGTMIERMHAWGLFERAKQVAGSASESVAAVTVTAIDLRHENIAEARRRLPRWAAAAGFRVTETDNGFACRRPDLRLGLELEAIDLFDFVARERAQRTWDLLSGHAVLDVLDIERALPALLDLVRRGGLCYFGLIFDGATILEPRLDLELDRLIEALYHESMDARASDGGAGESHAGRHIYHQLGKAGAEVLALGSSDWAVFPGKRGYVEDEAYFLHFIIQTIARALQNHPRLDPSRFTAWVNERHRQIEHRELLYIAHQLDTLARVPP